MKLTQPRMHPKWHTPKFKPFEPEGVTLGATVRIGGSRVVGQVWSKADQRNCWWVATDSGHYVFQHQDRLTVLGQCDDAQLELEELA